MSDEIEKEEEIERSTEGVQILLAKPPALAAAIPLSLLLSLSWIIYFEGHESYINTQFLAFYLIDWLRFHRPDNFSRIYI